MNESKVAGSLPRQKIGTPVLVGIVAFLYFLCGKFSFFFLSDNDFVTIGLFASEGVALAFALYFGPRVIPGIFLGQWALAMSNGLDFDASVVIGLVNSAEALLAIRLLGRFGFDSRLRTFRDFGLLFGTIVLVLQPFSALLSNAYLVFDGAIEAGEFVKSVLDWGIGNTMGQFLFTPFILLLFENFHRIKWLRFFAFVALVGLYLYLLIFIIRIENPFLLFNLTFPLVVVIVSRYGLFYGTLFDVVVAGVAAYSVHRQTGAFFVHSQMNNVINYDLFIFAHVAIVIIMGVLFDERRRTEERLTETVREEVEKNRRQQALMLQQGRLAQMGEMISMIAHQWRQPLNNLSLINQILVAKHQKGQLDEEAIEYFKGNSRKQIRQMSQTIDDFRNFYKSEKEKRIFCVEAAIEGLLELVEVSFKEKHIKIQTQISGCHELEGYPNEFAQALLNILNNAKDAFDESASTSRRIRIEVTEENRVLQIHICDNAGGIPSELLDKIYDPYFSTKSSKNGTGLGLYITSVIITEHFGGEISVVNRDGGACFTIRLDPLSGDRSD